MKKLLIAIPSNIGRDVFPVPFTTSLIKCVRNVPLDIDIDIRYFSGLRIDAVRINMVLYALQHKFDAIVFFDDDMIFPEDALVKMIAHWKSGIPIVSGLYGAKSMPFHYFVYPIDNDPFSGNKWLLDVERKLYDVKTIATGCLLVDMKVFDIIDKPWFLLRMDKNGRITATEDCFFGLKCYAYGVRMVVDATIQCEHLKLVSFPKLWENPYHHYDGEPACLDKTQPQPNPYPCRQMLIHASAGFYDSDGLDDCEHSRQVPLVVNRGEQQHYQCLDCGLVTVGKIDLSAGIFLSEEQIQELEEL